MPNTAVKPTNAESTWGEAPWEDRKPLIKRKRALEHSGALFLVVSSEWRVNCGLGYAKRIVNIFELKK